MGWIGVPCTWDLRGILHWRVNSRLFKAIGATKDPRMDVVKPSYIERKTLPRVPQINEKVLRDHNAEQNLADSKCIKVRMSSRSFQSLVKSGLVTQRCGKDLNIGARNLSKEIPRHLRLIALGESASSVS